MFGLPVIRENPCEFVVLNTLWLGIDWFGIGIDSDHECARINTNFCPQAFLYSCAFVPIRGPKFLIALDRLVRNWNWN